MITRQTRSFALFAITCAVATVTSDAFAQRSRVPLRRGTSTVRDAEAAKARGGKSTTSADSQNVTKTTVTVEVLTGDDGVGLRTQEWRPVFEELGYSLTMRRGTSRDKVEVRERMLGRLREVKVVGKLDAKGRLVFPERSFSPQDSAKLLEWLRELETYGAQGSPEGKPLWGLIEAQYKAVRESLSQNVTKEPQGLVLEAAVQALELPAAYPLRMSTDAKEWLKGTFPTVPPVRQKLKGISKGTALSILVNEYGMGFRPLRTQSGTIELVVDPLTKTTDVWPIGWAPKQNRRDAAPKLFELKPVEIEEMKLTNALDFVASETGIPIFIDRFGIGAQRIDLDGLIVSHRFRQTAYSLVLSRLTNPQHLNSEIRVDELGQPFVWVSVLTPGKSQP